MNIFSKIVVVLSLLAPTVVLAAIDLQITPANITFSNPAPIEREIIVINATFSNTGNQNASNVLVIFFDDSVPLGNATVSVPAFSSVAVSKFWEAEIGPNNISIMVDPSNAFLETNESNNNAAKRISIDAYHTYFGKARAITALGIGFDSLFETENAGCNLLLADTDSNVDFSSLQALGIKENGGNAKKDFLDLDIALNMTKFGDSISLLYSKDGEGKTAKETNNLFVFGSTINKVPVINSTNSTFFRTGILWDASDDSQGNNGQFDVNDKEDLVFIANINQSTVGKFGIYDYEIKVPALLRDYKPGSSTIDFFLDIDSICS